MDTESKDTYNKGIREIVDILYSLRKIEFISQSMSAKYNKARSLIDYVTILLADKKNFVSFRPMWDELHDRMVYYYDFLNNENMDKKIPLFRVTLHNEAVNWWMKCKKKHIIDGPLIHFDTHDDMGLPDTSKYLLKSNGDLNENGISKGSCGKIYWPVTCMLMSKGVNHVIWAMPKWIYDDNACFDQVLTCTKKSDVFLYLRPKGQKKDNFRIEGDVVVDNDGELKDMKKYKFYHPHRLDRIRLYTSTAWKKLGKKINSKYFMLDIDLDFFVTNGDKHSLSSYKQDFDDIESDGRVHGIPGIVTPRTAYDDDMSRNMIKDLNKEMYSIKKRVKTFLDGLYTLKKMGIKPCCINISDSSPSFFSGNAERAVFTNQYTPKYFVPLLHTILISGIRKIYGDNKFY